MEESGRRFDRIERLIGARSLERLKRSHVMVFGAGGVGSWAAESLARSGVGRLSIVDFDTVAVVNFNRQLQALDENVGRPKAQVLAERLRRVNPEADIRGVDSFFGSDTCAQIMAERPDFVIDAIDHITSKCCLISYCRERKVPVVVSTGSGGRLDPTRVRVADLARTDVDPLARAIREILKKKHGFPKHALFHVPAVFSAEPPTKPYAPRTQGDDAPAGRARGGVIMGTAAFVTGAFGFACAAVALRSLIDS